MHHEIEIKNNFLSLISKQNFRSEDQPFLIKNFYSNVTNLVNWDCLDDAINNDLVTWEFVDQYGKIEIPTIQPFWLQGFPQQNKKFIHTYVNDGITFIILRACILNNNLRLLASILQDVFDVHVDIHIYGSKGIGHSFEPHIDQPSNFILQVIGNTNWTVYKNKMSNLLPASDQSPIDLEPVIECLLEPGDLLYIPSRHYHNATPHEPRLSLSIPCLPNLGNKNVLQWDLQTYSLNT